MKTPVLLLCLFATSCATTAGKRLAAELDQYDMPMPPIASGNIHEVVKQLEVYINEYVPPGRQIHIRVILQDHETDRPAELPDDPFLQVEQASDPVHRTGSLMVTARQLLEIFAEVTDLAIDIAPCSRTIVLFENGQQAECTVPMKAAETAPFIVP